MTSKQSPPDRYALVGHPVDHSRSPVIHQVFARQTRQSMTYELIDAEPETLEIAVRGFFAAGGRGLNVTVPHKESACTFVHQLSPAARKAGAVNTLTFLNGTIRGDNTDGAGFLRDVTVNEAEPIEGRTVLVLGAGGAARGILGPLLEARPRELVIANRTRERADRLVADFREHGELAALAFSDLAERGPFDLLVNATSAGLKGEPPPFPSAIVGPASFCYDLVYSSHDTPFGTWARSLGARRAVQGWGMLVEQAAESFFIWRGVRPDTAAIRKQFAR